MGIILYLNMCLFNRMDYIVFLPHKYLKKKKKSLLPLLPEFSPGDNLVYHKRRSHFISGAKGDKIRILWEPLFCSWLSVSLAGWYPVVSPLQLGFSGVIGLFHDLIKRLLPFKEATSSQSMLLIPFPFPW